MSRVLIVGGGRVGSHLAQLLRARGDEVTIVERRPDRCDALAGDAAPVTVVCGSGSDASSLERAGIRNADVVVAATGSDETNLVTAIVSRFEFGVGRVVARVVDPRNAWMFRQDMGVDAALDQTPLIAHLAAEEMSLGEMTILLELRRGSLSLVEETIHAEAPAVDRTLAELEFPTGCVIVAVIGPEGTSVPHGSTRLRAGDQVFALVADGAAAGLAALLGPPTDRP